MSQETTLKSAGKKEFFLIFILPVLIVVIIGIIWTYQTADPITKDKEFDKGSRIEIESLTEFQSQQLQKLCKVWGFAKYYHPVLVSGTINWDYELFRIMPFVLAANEPEAVNQLLFNWIGGLGTFETGSFSATNEVALEADLDWIDDTSYLSEELSGLLTSMSNTSIGDRSKAFASFNQYGYVNFSNEIKYPSMDAGDDGYRLLTLFRYWNIIEYYFPYKDIIGEDWDDVFLEKLPQFIDADTALDYKLAVANLVSAIHDTHASIYDGSKILERYWGLYSLLDFQVVEQQVALEHTISEGIASKMLLPGDVILSVDGKEIKDVVSEKTQYVSMADSDRFAFPMRNILLRHPGDTMKLTLNRDGEVFDTVITMQPKPQVSSEKRIEPYRILDNNIGYLYPGSLERGTIDSIMGQLMNTQALIVDMRCYPSDFIVYTMGKYLMPHPTAFCVMSFANPEKPGEFVYSDPLMVGEENPDYYKGKIVILMNGDTMSQAEFTVMAFSRAPHAVVIGSETAGADGNIINFSLSPDINTVITGLGTFYPDRSQTQRIGLKPDILVEPTLKGLREGRDELMEKALEIIGE